jgi:hypothetical protein
MAISSAELQVPFVMVHLKTDVPAVNPVITEAGFEGVEIVPLPETFVHSPLPIVAVFPVNVTVVVLQSV